MDEGGSRDERSDSVGSPTGSVVRSLAATEPKVMVALSGSGVWTKVTLEGVIQSLENRDREEVEEKETPNESALLSPRAKEARRLSTQFLRKMAGKLTKTARRSRSSDNLASLMKEEKEERSPPASAREGKEFEYLGSSRKGGRKVESDRRPQVDDWDDDPTQKRKSRSMLSMRVGGHSKATSMRDLLPLEKTSTLSRHSSLFFETNHEADLTGLRTEDQGPSPLFGIWTFAIISVTR